MAKAPTKKQNSSPAKETTKPRGRELGTDELVQVTGGKITMQDFHFVMKEDKASH
jgi:hypothetical protein